MNFATAIIEMCYRGHKIKRPHWKGYWRYDAGRDQVIIHTKNGNEFPITETSDIVYTLMSCSADDWQVVIEDGKKRKEAKENDRV